MPDETATFNEASLSKGQLRKLNALRKTLGDEDIAKEAFAKWLEKYGASAGDRNAAALSVMILKAIQAGDIQLPRGGYLVRRGRGRVIVEPANAAAGETLSDLLTPGESATPAAGPRIERPAGMSPREKGWRNRIEAIPEAARTEAAILAIFGKDSLDALSDTMRRIFDDYTTGDRLSGAGDTGQAPESAPEAQGEAEGGEDTG